MRQKIKLIIIEEFSKVIDSIQKDFSKNYKNKQIIFYFHKWISV